VDDTGPYLLRSCLHVEVRGAGMRGGGPCVI
jgi:hypothetical protein